MLHIKNQEVKTIINRRLSRIEGQIRGVKKMVDEDRDCKDIVQQLIAIRAAVQATSLSFMQDVATDCLLNQDTQEDPHSQHARLTEMIQMLGKIT